MTAETSNARGDVRGLVDYDAGLLNDFGGGDVIWWQDYLRAEIERANEFWREQTEQALTAAQQQGRAKGCHCATCTCRPGMTPAVRFDTTPADKEGAVRDHLIALGWTPPGAQQPAAVVVDDTRGRAK